MANEDLDKNHKVEAALLQIINERNHYRNESAIKTQTIHELVFQIVERDRLLANAHRKLYVYDPRRQSRSPPQDWIGVWLTDPQQFPALLPVEDTWRNGRLQAALNQMPEMLARDDLGLNHRVNARLLYTAMIWSSGGNIAIALQYAEEALDLATWSRLHKLAGKAQFHRGLCYLHLGEPSKAKWCFVVASHLEDHADTIRDCLLQADREVEALPIGDPKRALPLDFEIHFKRNIDHLVSQSATDKPIYA